MNGTYLSGGGGLFSTAEDYLRFGQMLANGGILEGNRLLGRRTVEMMASIHIPDTLPRRTPGEGYGLTMRVIAPVPPEPSCRTAALVEAALSVRTFGRIRKKRL
jgi:CubicO group peptidase (beta-lactamase class C family)